MREENGEHTITYGAEDERMPEDTITHDAGVVRNTITYKRPERKTIGERARPRKGKVSFYFANVTSWSQKALDYLVTPGTPFATADVAGIVEHHKRGHSLTTAVKQLHKLGWRVSAQACTDTGVAVQRQGQGHGGVWIQSRSHLQQRGLSAEAKGAIQLAEYAGMETQWTARTIRMSGYDVVFAVVYLAPGDGLQGSNYITLQEVGTYLKVMGAPFILAGDFNQTVEELLPCGPHAFLGAVWRSPPGGVPGGHRGIDHLLISRPLAARATLHWDLCGPWAQPHTGYGRT